MMMSYYPGSDTSLISKFGTEYLNKGYRKNQLIVGLPFYGATPGAEICYNSLLAGLSSNDTSTNKVKYKIGGVLKDFDFSNVDAITKKVKWAKQEGYGGVMAWHWRCDNPPGNVQSLTRGIANALQ